MMSFTMEKTSFMGIAKPRPSTVVPPEDWEYLAETMPTTSPYWLNRGPPEFPGLMEVSVWMARSTQETMPPDMEKVSSPRGLPMASTWSPTFSVALSPRVTGWRSSASTLMTAMS